MKFNAINQETLSLEVENMEEMVNLKNTWSFINNNSRALWNLQTDKTYAG